MKIITLMSLCDFIANSVQWNGVPSNRDLCTTQAVLQIFFYPASWLWTVILTYLLYSLVAHGKISLAEWKMHLIVWGICTGITVLPLTTSTYGHQADDDYFCWIHTSSHNNSNLAAEVWSYVLFDSLLFACFFIMTLLGALMFYKLRIEQIPKTQTMISALRTLLRYPVALFITWFPNLFYITFFPSGSADSSTWIAVSCLSTLQGAVTAIIFFISSRESRYLWWGMFSQLWRVCCGKDKDNNALDLSLLSAKDITLAIEEDFDSDDAYYGRAVHAKNNESDANTQLPFSRYQHHSVEEPKL
jgi:hypothetical protein